MKQIYLDNAAATPLLSKVLDAMRPYETEYFHNPSGLSLASRKVRQDIKSARNEVARQLAARPGEIIFTAGGTEANNLAIHGVMNAHQDAHLITTNIEHEAVLRPAEHHSFTTVPVEPNGIIDPTNIVAAVNENTVLISVMYVNNEIGTIQPLHEIANSVQAIRSQRQKDGNTTPLYIHTDACQAANYLDLDVDTLGVDLMTLNGGKIYGPKQSGCLYVRSNVALFSLIQGGGQERNLRSGTENVSNIIGFSVALSLAQESRTKEARRLSRLQKQCVSSLQQSIPAAAINGSLSQRLVNNLSVTIPGIDNERVLMELEEYGIIGAAGSACAASKDGTSHVLQAIGLSDELARATLRFSMGRFTTEDSIQKVVDRLAKIVG